LRARRFLKNTAPWPEIFNHDAGIAFAILDRLLHQTETVVIEGKSYCMKDQIEPVN
jgi:DNA replication protein DnaC